MNELIKLLHIYTFNKLSLFFLIVFVQRNNTSEVYLSHWFNMAWHLVWSLKINFFFKFYFIFKLYSIVLVLPNIKMNLPRVYPGSPSWTLLPPSTPSLWAVPVHQPQASSIVHRTWTGDSSHTWYYTCFTPPSPSPTESTRLIYTSVSLLLSRTQGYCYCYHLSKFHIYVLVYCIGVFLSGLLHSED